MVTQKENKEQMTWDEIEEKLMTSEHVDWLLVSAGWILYILCVFALVKYLLGG